MRHPARSQQQALAPDRVFIDVNAVGDTPIIPGIPGTIIRISKVVLTAGSAVVFTLKEGTRENSGGLRLATNGSLILMFDSDMPLHLPAGQPLVLNLSEAIRLTGFVEYTQGE